MINEERAAIDDSPSVVAINYFAYDARSFGGLKGLIALAAILASWAQAVAAEEGMDGAALYQENCASCHGAELQGQPDWHSPGPDGRLPAPPHDATGHTWHHGDEILFRITRDGTAAVVGGGYASDMPGFGDALTDAEIRAILDYIKSTWPERERAYQRERTQQE